MPETHDVRLKIDAAAAKTGSRDFTSAIAAVKKAIQDLDRDSSGAFSNLKKNMESISKGTKIKVAGIDKSVIRDLERLAKSQQDVLKSTRSTVTSVNKLSSTLTALSSGYRSAVTSMDAFTRSVKNANTALARQITLARQAGAATRGVGGVGAGGAGATAGNAAAAAAAAAARAASNQARVQLQVEAALRRSTEEAARLVRQMAAIGNAAGVRSIQAALVSLRAALANGASSTLDIQRAMNAFNSATSAARITVGGFSSAATRASAGARDLANGATSIERQMRSVAGATNAASAAFRRATGSMRGLENAMSATYQVGSALRTVLGSLTLGSITKSVFEAGDALDQFKTTMEVAAGSTAEANKEIDFLDATARKLGLNLRGARNDYSKFATASSLAGVESAVTRDIFESVGLAMSVLGKGAEDQKLAFLALEQMMSKGVVSSEELRRQLGERLPGAVNLMAKALGVSTSELQKMLKAGEVISADALPKFAKLVRETFGPGFQKATERAGYNLQTLQVEIEKTLENTAQAGFMQSLTAGFQGLTNQLRSSQIQDIAVSIGEGLGRASELIIGTLSTLLENIDTVKTALSALVSTVLIRQVSLIAASFATWAAQGTAVAASLFGTTSATTSAAAAAQAHTAAIAADTLARLRHAAAVAAQNAAMNVNVGATTGAAARIAAIAAANAAAAAAAGGAATATWTFAGALTGLARAFTFLSLPIGLAVTALMFLPEIFGDSGSEADKMAQDIESAMRRAGVAMEEFKETAAEASSITSLRMTLKDINTLNGAIENFSTINRDKLAAVSQSFSPVQVDSSQSIRETGVSSTASTIDNAAMKELIGFSREDISSLSPAAKKAVTDIVELTRAAADGRISFLELREAAERAILKDSSTEVPIQGILTNIIEGTAAAEVGTTRLNDRLVDIYGSTDDKLIKNFANLAKEVVKTGSGMDLLDEQIEAAAKTAPHLVGILKEIKQEGIDASLSGLSSSTFAAQVQRHYDDTAQAFRRAQESVNETGKAFENSQKSLSASIAATKAGLEGLTGGLFSSGPVSNELMGQVNAAIDSFTRFKDVAISLETVKTQLGSIEFPNSEVQGFTASVELQFAALDDGQKTYANYSRILAEVAASNPTPSILEAEASLRLQARSATGAGTATEDFVNTLLSLSYPTPEAREFIQSMIDQALETRNAGQKAEDTRFYMANLASQLASTADAAYSGAADLRAFAAGLDAIARARSALGVGGGIAAALNGLREEARIATLSTKEKEIQKTLTSGAIGTELAKLKENINIAKRGINPGSSVQDAARVASEVKGLEAQVTNIEKEAESLIRLRISNEEAVKKAEQAERRGPRKPPKAKRTEHEKDLKSAADGLKDRLLDLEKERVALEILDSGQVKTVKSAMALAEMQIISGGAIDAKTLAIAREMEASEKLNETMEITRRMEEFTQRSDFQESLRKSTNEIIDQNAALDLLISGQVKTEAAAQRLALATRLGGEAHDEAAKAALRELEAQEKLNQIKTFQRGLQTGLEGTQDEIAALRMLASGQAATMDAATAMAQAQRIMGGAIDETTMGLINQQVEAVKLKEALERAAKDPVKDWLKSVPTWAEAGQQIELEVINGLSDAIANFAQTGKFNFEELGASILATATKIASDKAVKELFTLFGMGEDQKDGEKSGFDLGGILSGLFSSAGDKPAPKSAPAAAAATGAATTAASTASGAAGAASGVAGAVVGAAGGGMCCEGAAGGIAEGIAGAIESSTGAGAATLTQGIGAATTAASGTLQEGITAGSLEGSSLFGSVFGGFTQMLSGLFTSVFGEGGLFSSVSTFFGDIFGTKGDEVSTELLGRLNEGGEGVGKNIEGSLEKGGNILSDLLGALFGDGTIAGSGGGIGGLISGLIGGIGGGGGGGGGIGGIFTSILGGGSAASIAAPTMASAFFAKEGGLTNSPSAMNAGPILPMVAFNHAPHYKAGTTNTSGIPSMLHPNEAVIPLSKGRKVPVELGDVSGMSTNSTVVNQNFNFPNADVDSFRRSRTQIAASSASAAAAALKANS